MNAKYDRIGLDYNQTRKADPGIVKMFNVLLEPIANGIYLDIGCGTGNYTKALRDLGVNVIGVDPSDKMLLKARENCPAINWMKGQAENIPLEDNSVDGIMAMLTIHHWGDLQAGFSELTRVIKPNGHFILFTSTADQMEHYWLHHYFPNMMTDSIQQMPLHSMILSALRDAHWMVEEEIPFCIPDNHQDHFLYVGKHKPELYLNAQVRQGISSFADLSNQDEVTAGLTALKHDIETGEIYSIMSSYTSTTGDYLFIKSSSY